MERSIIEIYLMFEGRKLIWTEIYPMRSFNEQNHDVLLSSDTAKEILKSVDDSVYLGDGIIDNAERGKQPIECVSNAAKVCLMAITHRDLMFNMNYLDNNCAHGLYLSGLGAPTKWLWSGYVPTLREEQVVLLPEFDIETTGRNIHRVMEHEIPKIHQSDRRIALNRRINTLLQK